MEHVNDNHRDKIAADLAALEIAIARKHSIWLAEVVSRTASREVVRWAERHHGTLLKTYRRERV